MYRQRRNQYTIMTKITLMSFGYIVCTALLCSTTPGNAEVFEQLENGTISPIRDGVLSGTPSTVTEITDAPMSIYNRTVEEPIDQLEEELSGAVHLEAPARSGAVIFDDPGTFQVHKIASKGLPWHGKLQAPFAERRRMAKMAAEVATSYSRHPAVARARLDRAAFINLFTAMIHRESNFNPRAVSPKGAKGLGQLMPLTAQQLGVCNVFSPRENLEGAAVYLTNMLQQFGSPAMALAAYNAGPGAVKRYRGIPPYRETKKYVADIMYAAAGKKRGFGIEPFGTVRTYGYAELLTASAMEAQEGPSNRRSCLAQGALAAQAGNTPYNEPAAR